MPRTTRTARGGAIPAGYERAGVVTHSISHVHSFSSHAEFHELLEEDARASGADVVGVICDACGAVLTW